MVTRISAIMLALTLVSACASAASETVPPSTAAKPTPVSYAATQAPQMANTALLPTSTAAATAIAADAAPSDAPLQADTSGLALPPGFHASVYASGLHSPTAMAFGQDHKLYITQLNGGENDATGQVVVVDQLGAAATVVLEGLFKPTGLVWRGSDLFLAAGRAVLQTGDDGSGQLRQPVSIVHDLPFNTRSEGQIDLLPDGRLLFEASGLVQDPQSGRLFTLVPGQQPQELATGLKNAYGHAVDPASGQIYTSDVGDDPVDGRPPPDEINAVVAGGDYGWPRCYAERIPAADRGANAATCAITQPSLVTFPPHTTPAGLAFYAGSDFPVGYRDALYVALWNGNPPQVLRVTLQHQGDHVTGTATPFINGMKQPIDLLPDPNGGLLALDFGAGIVYRVTSQAR